jgi:predicted kinase
MQMAIPPSSSPTLLMMVGLPRSGKSSWASKQRFPIVSPDQIRLAIHGQEFRPEAEELVWTIARIMVRSLFGAGHRVVILDATNNTRARRDLWRSPDWIRLFKVIDTPVDLCALRAHEEGREHMVEVIRKKAEEWEPLGEDEIAWADLREPSMRA